MSEARLIRVIDIPAESTAAEAERILEDGLRSDTYVFAILPWASGARVFLKRRATAATKRSDKAARAQAGQLRAEALDNAARDIYLHTPDISAEAMRKALAGVGIRAGSATASAALKRIKESEASDAPL